MDSTCSTDSTNPAGSFLDTTPSIICPDCGNTLVIPEDASYLTCAQCGEELLVGSSEGQVCLSPLIPGLGEGLPARDWRIPVMTIHQLKAEVKDLEQQLEAVSKHGGLIDLARKTGFTAIFAGFSYAVLHSAANLPGLPYSFVGLLSGVLLHGGSHLVGKDYYTQKAALSDQIQMKRAEIEQNQQLLAS
jgi:ribosomal protein S27E